MKILMGGKEIEVEGWTLNTDPPEPVNGSLMLNGLKSAEGTFSGAFNSDDYFGLMSDEPVTVYLYGPADLSWWRHAIARFRERFFDTPYPTQVLYSGPATLTTEEDADGITVSGTFTRAGELQVDE